MESQREEYQGHDQNLCRNVSQLPKGRTSANIHCKCSLTLHLLQKKDGPPPLAYIGKLSCSPCWSLIQFLQAQGISYWVRGTHGKSYFPWKFTSAAVGTCFEEDDERALEKEFYNHIASRSIELCSTP